MKNKPIKYSLLPPATFGALLRADDDGALKYFEDALVGSKWNMTLAAKKLAVTVATVHKWINVDTDAVRALRVLRARERRRTSAK